VIVVESAVRGEGVRRRGVRSEGEAYQDYRRGCGQNYSQQRAKDEWR